MLDNLASGKVPMTAARAEALVKMFSELGSNLRSFFFGLNLYCDGDLEKVKRIDSFTSMFLRSATRHIAAQNAEAVRQIEQVWSSAKYKN